MEGARTSDTPGEKSTTILAFDASCGTCRRIAEQVAEEANDRLEVRSLSDPDVQKLRERAFGSEPPWQPTLLEVSDAGVRGHTQRRLAMRLATLLGLRTSWRVLQILGESSPQRGGRTTGRPVNEQRRQLLRGAVTAVAGIGLVSSVGLRPAFARPGHETLSDASLKRLMGDQLRRQAARLSRLDDLLNVLPEVDRRAIAAIQAPTTLTTESEDGPVLATSDPSVEVRVAQGQVAGAATLALSATLDSTRAVVVREHLPDNDGIRTLAEIWELNDAREPSKVRRLSASVNGELTRTGDATTMSCPQCTSGPPGDRGPYRWRDVCYDLDWQCFFHSCGPCAASCYPNPLICLGCALIFCTSAYYGYCCNQPGTECQIC